MGKRQQFNSPVTKIMKIPGDVNCITLLMVHGIMKLKVYTLDNLTYKIIDSQLVYNKGGHIKEMIFISPDDPESYGGVCTYCGD
jgi:hypothetical protein